MFGRYTTYKCGYNTHFKEATDQARPISIDVAKIVLQLFVYLDVHVLLAPTAPATLTPIFQELSRYGVAHWIQINERDGKVIRRRLVALVIGCWRLPEIEWVCVEILVSEFILRRPVWIVRR